MTVRERPQFDVPACVIEIQKSVCSVNRIGPHATTWVAGCGGNGLPACRANTVDRAARASGEKNGSVFHPGAASGPPGGGQVPGQTACKVNPSNLPGGNEPQGLAVRRPEGQKRVVGARQFSRIEGI
jgi:hypothetical protein